MDISGQGDITSATSRADVLCEPAYSNINTANGIIENAAKLGTISAFPDCRSPVLPRIRLLYAGADIWRGALDLGSGELKFNTNPVRTSIRNTVPEVYTKAVFPDLYQR